MTALRAIRFWKNPLFVKHCRSRFRPQAAIPLFSIAAILLLSYAYFTHVAAEGELDSEKQYRRAFDLLAWVASLVLYWGIAQVSSSVNRARELGILDFHRITPMTPVETAVGFLLGAPVREYVLYALFIPFLFYLGLKSEHGLFFLGKFVAAQLLTSLLFQAFVVAPFRPPSVRAGAARLAVFRVPLVAFVHLAGLNGGPLTPFTWFSPYVGTRHTPSLYAINYFGGTVPGLIGMVLYQTPFLVLFFLNAVRLFRSDLGPILSRPLGLMLVALVGYTLVAWEWGNFTLQTFPGHVLFLLAAILLVCGGGMVSTAGKYASALRRSKRRGRSTVPLSDDHGSIEAWVGCFCVPLLLLALLEPFGARDPIEMGRLWLCAGVASAVWAGYALGAQFFSFRWGAKGSGFFLLYLFFHWFFPLILSGIAAKAGSKGAAKWLVSLSPFSGVSASALLKPEDNDVLFLNIGLPFLVAGIFGFLSLQEVLRVRRNVAAESHA